MSYGDVVTVKLNEQLKERLKRLVDGGEVPSIEEGINAAVADLVHMPEDDLAWAKPYIERARESVARADVVDGETIIAELKKRAAR